MFKRRFGGMQFGQNPAEANELRGELQEFMIEFRNLSATLRAELPNATPDKVRRARQVMNQGMQQMIQILREPDANPGPATGPAARI